MSLRRAVLVGSAITTLAMAQPSAQSPTLRAVMRTKVDTAVSLLEPLVNGDFVGIDKYAERLSRISSTEIGSWQERPEGGYIRAATAFLQAVGGLREAARDRNLDRAVAEHAALVESCVSCHRYVRQSRQASLRVPPPTLAANPPH